MSRRGRRGVVISLFSFQDIITCVSGIIIIMVLLLALELVQRRNDGGGSQKLDVSHLEAALLLAESELEEMQAVSSEQDAQLRELADASPIALREQLDELRRTLTATQIKSEELRGRGQRLRDRHKSLQVKWFENKQKARDLADLRRRQAELRKEIDEVRQDDRPIYSMPRGTKLKGWLALVESGTITVAPLGRASRPTTFRGSKKGVLGTFGPVDEFMQWARRQPKASAYFFLIVRPDGREEFDKLEEALASQRFQFGFDLAGLDETVLDDARGAGE